MLDPAKVAFWKSDGLSKFKSVLFDRIGVYVTARGGKFVRGDVKALNKYAEDGLVPIVGCAPELTESILGWKSRNVPFCYWDRGYFRRIFAAGLPRAETGSGYYRWHIGGFQMQAIRDVPDDRWRALKIEAAPWRKGGNHIVIAAPTRTYARFHRCESWIADTIDKLARVTDRQLVIRDKESKRSLQADLQNAHALVTHGSIAAVEAVVLGYPVFVHSDSAAALVGQTDLAKIENPVMPDREPWLRSLAYSQAEERELTNGTLWRLIA